MSPAALGGKCQAWPTPSPRRRRTASRHLGCRTSVFVLVDVLLHPTSRGHLDDPDVEAGRVRGSGEELDVAHPMPLPRPHDYRPVAPGSLLPRTIQRAQFAQRPWSVISCQSVTKPVSRSTCRTRYSMSSSLNSMTAPHSSQRAWWCTRSVASS